MLTDDPVRELTHDHADLNRRVLELGATIAKQSELQALAPLLRDLREQLFLHFAREEEGLFPLVSDWIPELADQVLAMAVAHDTICGALARMVHSASTEADPAVFRGLFVRFQTAYAEHAKSELDLLQQLDSRLDTTQRAQLAELVRGL